MTEWDDITLLREFVATESEAAFATLVERHIKLVFSTAMRCVGNSHAAEEITQAVFIILAQKAGKLSKHTLLSGWLYQTARLTAANYLRGEIRRQKREQEAYMQSALNETDAKAWLQIAPLLDDALAKLGEQDRNALVLRFFEDKSLAEVGLAIGASEDAAKMRVNRALDKLRKNFTKRGLVLPSAVIAGAILTNSAHAVPATLANSVTVMAIAKGTAASGSTLTLIKGTLKIMAWTKAKMAVAVGVGMLLAAGTTTVVVKEIHDHRGEDWQKGWRGAAMVNKVPSQTTIRPALASRRASENGWGSMGGKQIGLGCKFVDIVEAIFSTDKEHLLILAPVPEGKFDYVACDTAVDGTASLQLEIERKFGLTIRRQFIETNVLILTIQNRNAPGLKPCSDTSYQEGPNISKRSIVSYGGPWLIVKALEESLGTIVVDGTGTMDKFDINLRWDGTAEGLKAALLDQLGMTVKLSPEPVPVAMYVVELVKATKYATLKQNCVADIESNGTVHYSMTGEDFNRTGSPLLKEYFGENLPIDRITDESGQPISFTNQQGVTVMTLNKPVPAGDKYALTIELTLPHWSSPTDKTGEFEWQLQSSISDYADSRSIEEYRLPTGAVLVSALSSDWKQTTQDGRVTLRVDRTIPRGGLRTAHLRYRLAGGK